MSERTKTNNPVASEALRGKIRGLIEQHGEAGALDRLRLSRLPVFRMLAGFPVHTGTIAQALSTFVDGD